MYQENERKCDTNIVGIINGLLSSISSTYSKTNNKRAYLESIVYHAQKEADEMLRRAEWEIVGNKAFNLSITHFTVTLDDSRPTPCNLNDLDYYRASGYRVVDQNWEIHRDEAMEGRPHITLSARKP